MVADMTLRFGPLRVPTSVRWPRADAGWLAFVVSDELSPADPWVENHVVVGLAGSQPAALELAALQWVADHAAELGAEADRVLVAGGARAAWLALAARDSGWPVLRRQLLVQPRFGPGRPMPIDLADAPRATVVHGRPDDDGRRYAERLRAAGVHVEEVRDDRRA